MTTLFLSLAGCQIIRRDAGPIAYVGDSAINAHIEIALVHDAAVSASEIDVHTVQGTVTLDGTVDDAAMKSAAERIARSTPGVHAVANHLKIERVKRQPPRG